MMKLALPKLVLLSSCSLICLQALAGGPEVIAPGFWPYMPGATATALSGQLLTGFGDGMFPIYGKPTEFFYIDPQGQINNSDQYAASLGIGGRYLLQDRGILGAYVFGDYNHSQNSNSFWFISPGLEFLGDVFDVTGNLYIPVSTQSYQIGSSVFGQDIGIFDDVTFAGHTEYDMLYNRTETDGFGGDIDVAYRMPFNPYNPKLHLGGYFSNPKDADNRAGGAIRLEFPFSENLSILVGDSYDNVAHNTVRAGASYSFGGRHTAYNYKHDLEGRMVDPIQRNLIANSSDIHNSQPIVENTLSTDEVSVYLTNISFFVPGPGGGAPQAGLLGAVLGDGTYENPYQGLTQDNVDNANMLNNRNLFVRSGTYGSPSAGMLSVALTDDNIMGRQSYNGNPFVKQASGTTRPELFFSSNGFSLTGSNSVSSLYLFGPGTNLGISQFHTSGNVETTVLDNLDISLFTEGVEINNQPGSGEVMLFVNNSSMHHNVLYGILFENLSILGAASEMNAVIENSNFFNNGSAGLVTDNVSNANMNVSINNISAHNNTVAGVNIDNANAATTGNTAVSLANSQMNNNGVYNLRVNNAGGGNILTNITNSTFNAGATSGVSLAVAQGGSINAVIDHSTMNNNASVGLGLEAASGSSGSINVAVLNGSAVLGNGVVASFLSTAVASTGSLNLTVYENQGSPVLWNGDVLISSFGTGSLRASFINKDGTQGPVVDTVTETVYCDSTGFCTTL